MRVLLTGGRGFVGRRLQRELDDAGHEAVAPARAELEVTDPRAVAETLAGEFDAIVHLAAVAFAPDADTDTAHALRVNVGGTLTLVEAIRRLPRAPIVLVVGSADVYAISPGIGVSLSEESPLGIRGPYGLTKVGQEAVAMEAAGRESWRLVVARAFNHTGPGQRRAFVVPALAERVRAVRDGRAETIPVGNLDVRRDLLHVDDVVVAYRLVLEALADGRVPRGGVALNVASGRTVSIREVVAGLQARAGTSAPLVVDERLVRANDPPEIRGDANRLRALTGWRPTRDLDEILDDVWADVTSEVAAGMIWVVLPTYNERANVETIVPAIRGALQEATILVVDDASPDGTGEIADVLAAVDDHVRVMHRARKEGLARAYSAGFDEAFAAGAKIIVQMDADWSHPPALLPILVARLEAGADLAIGSRYLKGGGTQGWPLKRRIISRCGNLFAQLVLTLPYPDLTGAYKAWRAEMLRAVDPGSIDATGYVFMIELVERAHLRHARIAQVPFIFVERREGVSKMSSGIFFEAFRHVIRLRLDRMRARLRRG